MYWRHYFPKLQAGREIDALIDFLICFSSNKFLGYAGSTFSEIVKYSFDRQGKVAVLI